MAITGYVVEYSFSGFQASNPDTPLPAAEIDNELSNVEFSIASIIAGLGQLRRSDGKLNNGVVSFSSLDAQVQAILNIDPRITVPDINPAAFAEEVEAEEGAATDKLMHPLATKQALDAQRPFSSQSQAENGLNHSSAMTPLRVSQAIGVQRAWATQAEAEAGQVAGKVMTPQRTAQLIRSIRKSFSAGAVLTWGQLTAGASATQTIAVPGAELNYRVAIGLPSGGLPAGVVCIAWVSAIGVITIRLTNTTAGSLTPTAAQSYWVTAMSN